MTPPDPALVAKVREKLAVVLPCVCIPAYRDRGLADPQCQSCECLPDLAALVASWVGPLEEAAGSLLRAIHAGVKIGVPVKAAELDAILVAENAMKLALAALPWKVT